MSHSATETEVRSWFDEYVQTFVRCAGSKSGDAEPLQKYIHTPFSLATDDMFLVLGSREEVARMLGHELTQLARSNYGGSTAIDPTLQVINRRAAVIAVTWSRTDQSGAEFQRLRVSYWVVKTDAGWRMTSSAVHK